MSNPEKINEELEEIAKDNVATLEAAREKGKEQGKKDFQAESMMSDEEKLLSKRRDKIFEEEEKVGHSIETLRQKVKQEKAEDQENKTE